MKEKIIKFQSYDGYSLDGTLITANKERAAVLFVHGITSSRDELGFHSDYAQFLSENGISSMRFDYRYHGIHETSLESLSLCGIVNDIDSAFEALKKNVKTASFIIVGTSFGGGLSAYWVNIKNKEEIRKVVLNAPVINYEDDVLKRNGLLKNGVLSKNAQIELDKKGFVVSSDIHFGRQLINELKYINGIKAIVELENKIVIFHGDADEDVPLTSSQKYKTKLSQLIIINDVGHGFGVENDEDLNFPETKAIHKKIYATALEIIENAL